MAAAGTSCPDLVADAATTHQAPTLQQSELKSRAREFVAREKFNRRFTLPSTNAHDELTVTYAVGGVDSDTAPTVLFIGGLYGGRRLATLMDHLGQSLGMRIVVVDRPGMGGSTIVDVSLRLSVWLETVPFLLRNVVKTEHVSVAAHSCGAIYALNTIHELPWILAPSNPTLHLFSPWVSTEHSGLSALSVSSYLPSPLINKFDSVVRSVNSIMAPTMQFSGVVSAAVSAPFAADQESGISGDYRRRTLPRHERDDICREYCGVSAAESTARSREIMRAMFGENTRGANHEALLTLRKGEAGSWGACDDYATYPDALAAKMRDLFRESRQDTNRDTGHADLAPPCAPLVIKSFWAEKDNMVSKKGEEYFNRCFERFSGRTSGDGQGGQYVQYESEVLPGSNHDTVCLPQYEGLSRAFRDMLGQ